MKGNDRRGKTGDHLRGGAASVLVPAVPWTNPRQSFHEHGGPGDGREDSGHHGGRNGGAEAVAAREAGRGCLSP